MRRIAGLLSCLALLGVGLVLGAPLASAEDLGPLCVSASTAPSATVTIDLADAGQNNVCSGPTVSIPPQ